MMNKKLILLYFILISIIYPKYSWERSASEQVLQKAIYSLYNFEFDIAIKLLDSAQVVDSLHPAIPFIKLSTKWLASQSKDGYLASYNTIHIEVDSLLPLYNMYIAKYPNDPEYLLYLGSTYGIRARTALAGKEWLSAFYSGYQGLRHILKAESLDDGLLDLYMPIGLMEYFACLSLAPVKWGASLIGISSDCSIGLEHLELAAKKSHYSWIESSNVLAYAYLHVERDYDKAEIVITKLVDNFPKHPYFIFLKGELLAKTLKFDQLDEIDSVMYKLSISGPEIQRKECNLKYNYIGAIRDYHASDYDAALLKSQLILNDYSMEFDWLKGFTCFLQAQIHERKGNRLAAIDSYEKVLKMDSYYPEVKDARKRLIDLNR